MRGEREGQGEALRNKQVSGFVSPLLRRQRNRMVARQISDGSRVLDIGCGDAPLLRYLQGKGKNRIAYTGVDNQSECIESLRSEFPSHKFFVLNIERDDLKDLGPQVDVISLVAVIEHLVDPAGTLKRLSALLSEEGRILVTAPRHGAEALYAAGVTVGLFSKEAHEDHKYGFPDRSLFETLSAKTGLRLESYKRFLLGFNQFVVFKKA